LRGNNHKVETAYLSLGSNLGDRYDYLRLARQEIEKHDVVEVLAVSSILETLPLGNTEQPLFLNQVLKIHITESAIELLKLLLEIEQTLGRQRSTKRWAPRTIDIDILLYGKEIHDTPSLRIPHPELLNRPFFLRLLVELDDSITHPVTGFNLTAYMKRLVELPITIES